MVAEAGRAAYEAIVVGAGPAGGTAALLLARAGWSVALVEKRQFPRRKLCGEYLSATSLPVLQNLGLGAAIAERSGPEIRRAALFAGEAELAFPMPQARVAASLAWGRTICRADFDLMLLEAAARAGTSLWQPFSATRLDRGGAGWSCDLTGRRGTRSISAPVIIVASGSWERGPIPARPGGGHRPSDLLAFKGCFLDCDLPRDLMPLLIFPGGYGGMVRNGFGSVNLSCCIRRDVLARCRDKSGTHAGDAVLQHIEAHCAGARNALRRARLKDAWLAAGPINPGIRKSPGDGLFLVGNLAGEAHPIVAEGISMAIQSAWLLCRRLIARQDDLAARRALAGTEAEYAAEWRRCFAGRLRAAGWFAHLAMRPRAVAAMLPLLGQFPGLLRFGAELSGKAKQFDASL